MKIEADVRHAYEPGKRLCREQSRPPRRSQRHPGGLRNFYMEKEEKTESTEEIKRLKLNFSLLIIGVIIAGISFAWHIIPLFFKG